MREVEPPRKQAREGLLRGGGGRASVVAADQRDADGACVETLGVSADHRPPDSAVPAFEDLAVLVDEEVVADVVPAVPLHVVELDRPHDRGRLGRPVAVRAGGVVDEREVDRRGVPRRLPPDLLVRVPADARDDRRRACDREAPQRDPLGSAAHEVRPQAPHVSAQAVTDRVRRAGPVGTPEPPATRARGLGAAAVGQVLGLGRGRVPGAPPAGEAPSAEEDASRPAPVQADELERPRCR